MEQPRTTNPAAIDAVEVETERIMKTGAMWLAAVVISVALVLGPLLASGWRPSLLPAPLVAVWWIRAVATAAGTALLVWAGCPVLGFPLAQAHRQKVFSVRVGIAVTLSGMAIAACAMLLASM